MTYNNIGKYLEEIFGTTEFWVYSKKDLQSVADPNSNLKGSRVVKTSAGIWLNVS